MCEPGTLERTFIHLPPKSAQFFRRSRPLLSREKRSGRVTAARVDTSNVGYRVITYNIICYTTLSYKL